jgi:hypothetical protein
MIIFKENADPDLILYKKYLSECIRTKDFTRFREAELEEGIKNVWNFIKEMASNFTLKIGDLVRAFKNKDIFKFFASFQFNFKNIAEAFKQVFNLIKELTHLIPQGTAKGLLNLGKKALPAEVQETIKNAVLKIDKFLKSKGKFGQIIFACFLIWVWLQAGLTGDVSYDFDASEPLNAIRGKLTFAEFFLGDNGDGTNKDGSPSLALEYLGLIILGKLGYGGILPYAEFSNSIFLAVSLIQYFAKEFRIKINKGRNSDSDIASAEIAIS